MGKLFGTDGIRGVVNAGLVRTLQCLRSIESALRSIPYSLSSPICQMSPVTPTRIAASPFAHFAARISFSYSPTE